MRFLSQVLGGIAFGFAGLLALFGPAPIMPRPIVAEALEDSPAWRWVAAAVTWFMAFGLLALLALLMLAGIAHAAEAAPTAIDLGPIAASLIEILAPIVLAGLSAIAAWAFALFRKKTGWQIDQSVGLIVDQGLQKAVDFAASRLRDRVAGGIPLHLRNEAIRIAAGYATQKLPGALKHFKIDPANPEDPKLTQMIEARLEEWLVDPETERSASAAV
ncbi:hypothetical protein E3C22_16575 [Jiella endophytica]|uniref:Uncharacterized protein n=1 Tax=Jiella endophytica TaxID=2558362 RepID=A0A4Y8REM1_9HYPH|nr:hypothetical protein [Jiella endophytica]TFF20524.1 hypothetical protein E3C22_16575 [Jiella endophytica]